MWLRSTEHKPDIDKWIRDETQCRTHIQLSSGARHGAGGQVRGMSRPGARVTGHRRCDTVCRLPCSLQPLDPGHPRPRPRLETEADWARARLEVEERRERERQEEAGLVKKSRHMQEREQSEAVRIARSKLLDKVIYLVLNIETLNIVMMMQEVAEDWKFQVLHKHKLKVETTHEEKLRSEEEKRLIQENMEKRKMDDHRKLQQKIQDRIEEEHFQRRLKDEESKRIENKHIGENKESYKITDSQSKVCMFGCSHE